MTLLEAEKSTAALPEAGASSLLLPKTGTSSSLDACAALHASAAGRLQKLDAASSIASRVLPKAGATEQTGPTNAVPEAEMLFPRY